MRFDLTNFPQGGNIFSYQVELKTAGGQDKKFQSINFYYQNRGRLSM